MRSGGTRRADAADPDQYRRLQRLLVLVCLLLVTFYAGYAASLMACLGFAVIVGALGTLAVRALGRQQVAADALRRSEERLHRESVLLQTTIENIGDGLSVFDRDGRLVAANRRFGELLELPAELATGTPLREILSLQARRGDFGPVAPDEEVARRFDRFYRELPLFRERVTASGRILQIRRRAMPDGSIVTVYGDVTDIRAGDRQMVEARRLAERASRAKSDFLANMSHELRTPLNAIIGFSEVIGSEVLGPVHDRKYLEYINDIHDSGLHLLSIINDVLDMSKIEAGETELDVARVSVAKTVAATIRVMQERAASRDIELIVEIPRDDLEIRGDDRAMRQVLLNLLANAVKFSEIGGKVWVRAAAVPPGAVVLEVADHGIGMSVEEQERALQPFGQAATGAARPHGGVGLGLPITRGLVEAQGGRLTIDSTPGLGTTVRLSFAVPRDVSPVVSPSPTAACGTQRCPE